MRRSHSIEWRSVLGALGWGWSVTACGEGRPEERAPSARAADALQQLPSLDADGGHADGNVSAMCLGLGVWARKTHGGWTVCFRGSAVA
eukprot:3870094-Rhodomonas_salina.2